MEPCSTSSSIQIKREDWNKLLVNYGLNIKWLYKGRYAYPSQQGDAVVSLKIDNFQCKSGTEITAELTAKIDKIDNPKLLINKFANIYVDWSTVDRLIEPLVSMPFHYDGESIYKEKFATIVSTFENVRKGRYISRSNEVLKMGEKLYPLEYKVLIGRLQRAFLSYKFDEKNSRMFITDKVTIIKNTIYDVDVDYTLSINIFPETDSRTSVVYELQVTPIEDRFAEKLIFGKKDAVEFGRKLIESLEERLGVQ
jgi:hypothetical protein